MNYTVTRYDATMGPHILVSAIHVYLDEVKVAAPRGIGQQPGFEKLECVEGNEDALDCAIAAADSLAVGVPTHI